MTPADRARRQRAKHLALGEPSRPMTPAQRARLVAAFAVLASLPAFTKTFQEPRP